MLDPLINRGKGNNIGTVVRCLVQLQTKQKMMLAPPVSFLPRTVYGNHYHNIGTLISDSFIHLPLLGELGNMKTLIL